MDSFEKDKKVLNKKHVKILLIAIAVGIFTFSVTYQLGILVVTGFVKDSGFTSSEEQQYIDSFQQYVTDNKVESSDLDMINRWIKTNPDVAIMLYDQERDVFLYCNQDYKRGQDIPRFKSINNTHTIGFADGDHEIFVSTVYTYKFYFLSNYLAMILGFVAFFIVYFGNVNRRTKYIVQLTDEMELLGSGNLNYEITVKGNDELAYLADNLNQMRIILLQLIEEEEHLAHDIKTPLTSILLFTELLEQGKYETEEQKNQYIEKIRSGATHINEITEQLMQHTHNGEKPVDNSEGNATVSLQDMLGEMVESLSLSRFTVEKQIDPAEKVLAVGVEVIALTRILENIRSNIIKYADIDFPVEICARQSEDNIFVEFRNTKKQESPGSGNETSKGIGLKSVHSMMQNLGGQVETEAEGNRFVTRLIFTTLQ